MPQPDVLIIGAGLAGLSCARKLHQAGIGFHIVEAADAAGGRVRTDNVNGFLLDRGFQVLLTSYPEPLRELDYESLQLRAFDNATLVRYHGEFYRLVDPWRVRGHLISNLLNPIGTVFDKNRTRKLRSRILRRPMDSFFTEPESTTLQALAQMRFSNNMIERFFRPFLGGICLDTKLCVSSRWFEYVFRMFSEGDAALPARGMQAIPDQLAAPLPTGSISFNRRAASIDGLSVTMEDGEVFRPNALVVATEGPSAARLLKMERPRLGRSVTCYYFAARESPLDEPILVLSGSTRGTINNLCVPNIVQPTYAPNGQNLISVTVVGNPTRDEDTLRRMVRSQLKRWFGLVAQEWKLISTYRIEYALPVVQPMEKPRAVHRGPGVYVAGDHCATPSIQGAMESGRLAAEALIEDARLSRTA